MPIILPPLFPLRLAFWPVLPSRPPVGGGSVALSAGWPVGIIRGWPLLLAFHLARQRLFLFPPFLTPFLFRKFNCAGDIFEIHVFFLFRIRNSLEAEQVDGFFAFFIHGKNLGCQAGIQGEYFPSPIVAFIGVIQQAFEDIGFYQHGITCLGLQPVRIAGEALQGIEVSVELVIEAALEAAAHTREFGLVDGQVLVTGSAGSDRAEISQPGRTTQFAPAGADAADAGRFLARADLAHFDFHAEFLGVLPDELAEVNPPIGSVKEGCFALVGLVFHIPYFHIQVHGAGDDARADHGGQLQLTGFVQAFQVALIGVTDDAVDYLLLFGALFAHLHTH